MCLVWHTVLSRTVFNSGNIQAVLCFLKCVSLSLTPATQFLNASLLKRADGFSSTGWTLNGAFKSGWSHCLFGWIVTQASTPLWCFSSSAWFSYPLCLSLMLGYLATRVKGQQSSPDQSFVSNIHYKRYPANSNSVIIAGAWEEMTGN